VGLIQVPSRPSSIGRRVHGIRIHDAQPAPQLRHGDHSIWLRVPNPGEAQTQEVIGVDFWMDADRMNGIYAFTGLSNTSAVFAGAPDTSVWQSPRRLGGV